VFLQGHAVHSSYVQSGTLVEASHLPAYSVTDNSQSCPESTTSVARTTSLLTGLRQQSGTHSVVLFSASLAGGWDEDTDICDAVELSSDVDVDQFVVDRLLATAQTVVDCGASILACQKVNSLFLFIVLWSAVLR